MEKICGACGERFFCSASAATCWCEAVELTAEARASLRNRYADCLCPRCLPGAAIRDVAASPK